MIPTSIAPSLLLFISAATHFHFSTSLIPYRNGGHEDPHRTHRYVRSCDPLLNGTATHVNVQPKLVKSVPPETFYISYAKTNGHHTIVRDPHMLSVYEPNRPGSCKHHMMSPVLETAKHHRCAVAINAGFFNPNKDDHENFGKCYGNIISDGKVVQDSKGIQNACFGIRSDGTVVIGYLSEEEVLKKSNPFQQLVCGVGWVLRDGKEFLTQSAKAECKETETTGTLEEFFNVRAARTLIGTDKNGHVHLVQFDGETHHSGVNLSEAAAYMKSIGIVNAINFDGGGSSTYVAHSTIINYPNLKQGRTILKARNVSTIICIHDNKKHKSDHIAALTYCCNRNYLIIIGLTVFIGASLLANVYMYGYFVSYRSGFSTFSGTQKKEALKSLLDQNGRYSTGDDDSDEDEL